MKAPVSWLREYAALPEGLTGRELAEALIRAGLEVETVEEAGAGVGPLVVGRVIDFVDEPQKNGKVIRWCHVDVGAALAPDVAPAPVADRPLPEGVRGIICGAHNFAVGDLVVVGLPGTVLAGGFTLTSRKTYGHLSDGMICAEDELGIGEDHSGIIVLPADAGLVPGDDPSGHLGLGDDVLDINVSPDMSYCLSIRGLAREAALAYGVPFTDVITLATPGATEAGYPVRLADESCPLFVSVTVTGIDQTRPTPAWLVRRLQQAGMRSISLVVDISNYAMLTTGQPNHTYDADRLRGPIVVRKAVAGETCTTLDSVVRTLVADDLLITDDSGPIGLAGVMGGETTEIRPDTVNVVVEAASFDPATISRSMRRHGLPSEASKRFERGVDPQAAYATAHLVAALLAELAGGTIQAAETVAGQPPASPSQRVAADLPSRILGMDVAPQRAAAILRSCGVEVVESGDELLVTPPSWRGDLRDPYDYVEEVGRKLGFDQIPSVVPAAPVGRGLTRTQRGRRAVGQALVASGFVEALIFPFQSSDELDRLGLAADDDRRALVRLANPLSETAPCLRTTMLPGLLAAAQRNVSRGLDDVALFELGSVFLAGSGEPAPSPGVTGRPSEAELAAIEAALPRQPRHLAAVVAGQWRPVGWQGTAEPAGWQQVFAIADVAARAVGATLTRIPDERAPWHPGRCAALVVAGETIGHAGELHPTVCRAFGVPPRSAALELDLDALLRLAPGPGTIAPVSGHPVAKEDVALVVAESVPAGLVRDALIEGAGPLLESIHLFDIYRGAPIPEGSKSLAFALRFRAADRTLKEAEINAARDAAVARAGRACGAVQRA